MVRSSVAPPVLLQTLQFKENHMATKKEKLSFSKFFPESTSYVVLEGYAKGSDDFDITLKVGDGGEHITLFATDWYNKNGMLKAVKEAVDKALEFQEKAIKMAKVEAPKNLFEDIFPAPKKAAPKKKVAKK